MIALIDPQHRAVDHRVTLSFTATRIDNSDFAVPGHHRVLTLGVADVSDIVKTNLAFGSRLGMRLLRTPRRRATDMEGAHGELSAGLTDGLGRNNAHGLSKVHHRTARKITPVALHADPEGLCTGQHRANHDLFDAGVLDGSYPVLIDFFARGNQHLGVDRIQNIRRRYAAEDSLSEGFYDIAPLHQRAHFDGILCTAILAANDHVLGNVHQAAGEIPGVRCLERRIRQALSRAVGRDEVLKNRQPFAKVRGDRRLDDRAGRLGHQTTHARELPHLLSRTPSSGICHHKDRIEAGNLLFRPRCVDHGVFSNTSHQLFGDLFRGLRPDIDDLVVALAVRDQTFLVLIMNLGHFRGRFSQVSRLVGRNRHIVEADRNARTRGVSVSESPQPVGEKNCGLVTQTPVALVDQLAECLLVHHLVDEFEVNL